MSRTGPTRILHVDLAEGIEPVPADGTDRWVQVVLWWRDLPLGELEFAAGQLPVDAGHLRHEAARAVSRAVGARLFAGGFDAVMPERRASWRRTEPPGVETLATLTGALAQLDRLPPPVAEGPTVSVVVCTRDRPDQLTDALASLERLTPPPEEVVVVDNAPTSGATREVVEKFAGVRYVEEPRPGLSVARNTGIRETTGAIVAFTDDDAIVHPRWVARLRAAFDAPDVMAVTGLVLPAALDSPGQVLFEKHVGGFGQGYIPRVFDRAYFERMRPVGVPVWKVGAGANMAMRRRAFEVLGGFDERLGAGAAGCSEDSEYWYRLLAAGWRCRYEPAAVVFHHHRADLAGVRAQSFVYLRGHMAALFVQFGRHRHWGNLSRAFLALPRYYLRRSWRGVLRPGRDPTLRPEVTGFFAGLAYLPLALREEPPAIPTAAAADGARRQRRSAFLAQNPYPHGLTEGFFFREKMRAIHRIAPEGPMRRILEVGGGQSGLTSLLYPGARVVNIDLDVSYAASPSNRRPGLRFVGADATRLPFPDAAFDAVTLFDVLEHIPDDAAAVREVLRVLRPGGHLLLTSPNQWWRFPYHAVLKPVCPTDLEVMAEWGHVRRGYTVEELDGLVGARHVASATFINPVTVVAHDLAFSKLPGRVRRGAAAALLPLTWTAYGLHRPGTRGTETAVVWRKG